MKNLLIVSFDFPPIGGPAPLRMTSFVERLSGLGWASHVVTVREDQQIIPNQDPTLVQRLPDDCEIHRTRLVEPYNNPLYWLATGQRSKQAAMADPELEAGPEQGNGRPPNGRGLGSRLKGLVESMVLPDRVAGWIPFALRRAIQITREQPIDAVLTTAPPASAHVVGALLQVRTGLPWVAEFRDPWTRYAFAIDRPFPFDRIEAWLERRVLQRATRVVCVTDTMIDAFVADNPRAGRSKFTRIAGFYDESHFGNVEPARLDKFTIVFPGQLYETMAPHTLFEGLVGALDDRPAMRDRVACLFVGRQYDGLDELVARWQLDGVVERLGFRSNQEALELLFGSQVAYYCTTRDDLVIPSKLFEYLRSGRHILAVLPPDHPAAHIIRETESGTVVPPRRPDLARTTLVRLFDDFVAGREIGRTGRPAPAVARYDGREQARQLREILDEIT
ncbi:MAG: glycosyltransferase [Gemmatimonadota bacterium]